MLLVGPKDFVKIFNVLLDLSHNSFAHFNGC